MIFADLVAGDSVFVDANTFIYHFGPDPVLGPPSSQLLQRIESQELAAFTSIHLLGEVVHKLMTIEAHARFGWPLAGMANRLRRHPAEVQQLTAYRRALDQVVSPPSRSFFVSSHVSGWSTSSRTRSSTEGKALDEGLFFGRPIVNAS
jgi:predicted nucleic acid-binding protein